MKVSGFTIIRNALMMDYPIVEAITSILPVCDEMVVAVGQSNDATLDLIKSIGSEKIKIIQTIWDDSIRAGGQILAIETNKAFQEISPDSDWAFYIQADEVVHEKYLPTIREAMIKYKDNPEVDGLLFNYLHFYGSYDYVGDSYEWYPREIRVIKNNKNIFSYRDAQGFRKKINEKLRVKSIDAFIYHFGWVRHPKGMRNKDLLVNKFWHDDQWIEEHVKIAQDFQYSNIHVLNLFDGTYPLVMQKRIKELNWNFTHDISKNKYTLKNRIKMWVEKMTGWRIGEYKNYKII
jgi:hypothetical protein